MGAIKFISQLNAALSSAGRFDIRVMCDNDELYSRGLTSIELLLTVVDLEKKTGQKLDPSLIPQIGRLTVRDLRLALGGEL